MTSRFHVDPRGILVATWKIFVDAFIIVVCVSGRVGEPSLKSPSVVEEGEKRVYIARLPSLPFPRLTMRFMPALKRFSQKKRVRVNVDGAGEGQGNKDGGRVMILEMIYSFSSPRFRPSFLPTQKDETIERCVNDFAHCLYIFREDGI